MQTFSGCGHGDNARRDQRFQIVRAPASSNSDGGVLLLVHNIWIRGLISNTSLPLSVSVRPPSSANGNQSVLIADNKDDKLFLLAGSGTGTLAAPVNYYPGGGKPRGLTVADFN